MWTRFLSFSVLSLVARVAFPDSGPPAASELIVAPGARVQLESVEADAAVEAALGGGLLRRVDGFLLAPPNGDHWLAVAARDAAGNLSELRWVSLRVDAEPPTVQIRLKPEAVADEDGRFWLPAGSSALAEAADELAGVRTSVLAVGDAVSEAQADRCVVDLPAAGDLALRAWAEDRVGNRSVEVLRPVSIDSEPPAGEILVSGPQLEVAGALIVGPGASAEIVLSDAGSGLKSWTPVLGDEETSEANWRGPWSAGRHSLGGWAFDRVGNRATVGARGIHVDANAPEVSWEVTASAVVERADGPVYRPPVTVRVSAEDAPAGVASLEWSSDGSAWTAVERELQTWSGEMQIRAVDRVGNEGRSELAWTIDADPPRLEVRGPSGEAIPPGAPVTLVDGEALELVAIDAGAGLAGVRYSLHEGRWEPAPERIRFRGPGVSRLSLHAADRLGHSATGAWSVEVTPKLDSER